MARTGVRVGRPRHFGADFVGGRGLRRGGLSGSRRQRDMGLAEGGDCPRRVVAHHPIGAAILEAHLLPPIEIAQQFRPFRRDARGAGKIGPRCEPLASQVSMSKACAPITGQRILISQFDDVSAKSGASDHQSQLSASFPSTQPSTIPSIFNDTCRPMHRQFRAMAHSA